jgi:hypothetical protein
MFFPSSVFVFNILILLYRVQYESGVIVGKFQVVKLCILKFVSIYQF